MNFEYIIIQAGGKGIRMGNMTLNRPKAMVPVNNIPMIFYLFNKYPDKKFIIIGDYQFNVLKKYLNTFTEVSYLLVHAHEEGNIAGLKEALSYIPGNNTFMLIWSDLILSESFSVESLETGCYIGISETFKCSWSFLNGNLEKKTSTLNGIAGCYLFDSKKYFNDIPIAGSFAEYLQTKNLELLEMSMMGSVEVGTKETVIELDFKEYRCRPYNILEFSKEHIVKRAITEDGEKLLNKEIIWYKEVANYGFEKIPKIYSETPLIMEEIYGLNIFKAPLDVKQKKVVIDNLVDALTQLHNYKNTEIDYFDLVEDYYNKTMKRIRNIRHAIPFTENEFIQINDRKCKNVFFYSDLLEQKIKEILFDTKFGMIHGDCTLTNTMIDKDGKIYFIDARGYFGKHAITGDIYYDWAKLYYSIYGRFDQFNIKKFDLKISNNSIWFEIEPSGWEDLTEYFLEKIENCDFNKIKLIHSIIWLSLASHAWEDYDSMCVAFYNGIYLLEECL